MPTNDWFRSRHYKHFDRPVGSGFSRKAQDPSFVSRHSFSPLIHYIKRLKRYKKDRNKTEYKDRPIMYASHRDSCILSYYSYALNRLLDCYYNNTGLNGSVIAYRALGKGNYNFSSAAYQFAKRHSPALFLAFDVTGFFDNLDHKLLKSRLRKVLDVQTLPEDWYKIFRFVTRYHFVRRGDLEEHELFGSRIKERNSNPIGTVRELKNEGIEIHPNEEITRGIPQGTPISATLSNTYMIKFDKRLREFCNSVDALYMRYSDDILIVCSPRHKDKCINVVRTAISHEKLELNEDKTDVMRFNHRVEHCEKSRPFQYLGFEFGKHGVRLRTGTLARQWRKMRRAIKRTENTVLRNIKTGEPMRIYTKKLRRQFTPISRRNFSSYARTSAKSFGENQRVVKQTLRLERAFERELVELRKRIKRSIEHLH